MALDASPLARAGNSAELVIGDVRWAPGGTALPILQGSESEQDDPVRQFVRITLFRGSMTGQDVPYLGDCVDEAPSLLAPSECRDKALDDPPPLGFVDPR